MMSCFNEQRKNKYFPSVFDPGGVLLASTGAHKQIFCHRRVERSSAVEIRYTGQRWFFCGKEMHDGMKAIFWDCGDVKFPRAVRDKWS